MSIYLSCYQVLQASKDPRAGPFLERACKLLKAQAEKIYKGGWPIGLRFRFVTVRPSNRRTGPLCQPGQTGPGLPSKGSLRTPLASGGQRAGSRVAAAGGGLMLTRAQIQRLAQRHHIGMQVQERDYLQHLLLSLLYTRSQALVFKGGTALRLVLKGNRYSEGLDFNGPEDVSTLRRLWEGVVASLGD